MAARVQHGIDREQQNRRCRCTREIELHERLVEDAHGQRLGGPERSSARGDEDDRHHLHVQHEEDDDDETIVFRRYGSVMLTKPRQIRRPSMRRLSRSSSGIVCSAPRNSSMAWGYDHQAVISVTAIRAVVGEENASVGPHPSDVVM